MDSILIILIGTAVVLFCIIKLKLHAVISLMLAALVTALLTSPELIYNYAIHSGMSEQQAHALSILQIGKRVAAAFGNTSAKVGILIALASVIGASLMRSGGAERIVRSLLKLFGAQNSALAILSASFLLTIPTFFETVFYLMVPIIKSLGIRNPKKFSIYLMVVIAGGVMAHSLVPPTPGPLYVAQAMGIDIGTMMIGGIIIGTITSLSGYVYALWANKKWQLPLRNTPDISLEDLKKNTEKEDKDLPKLWISVLPVLLPILLITGNTFAMLFSKGHEATLNLFQQILVKGFYVLGDPNVALAISAIIAMYLLWSRLKDTKLFQKFIAEALTTGGVIILITSSGGAFGEMLQQTGIGIRIENMAANYQIALIPMAFFITSVIRTAQGSATVAMVTTVGIMAGLSKGNGLHFHPIYLALAIGCGSKVFAWMNDAAFWVITKMSGMEEKETIRHFSFLMVVMAFTGLFSLMILSKIFPLV